MPAQIGQFYELFVQEELDHDGVEWIEDSLSDPSPTTRRLSAQAATTRFNLANNDKHIWNVPPAVRPLSTGFGPLCV
eukprot:SAG22_NODE_15_length_32914_cov_20.713546_4_plen_77_part_00